MELKKKDSIVGGRMKIEKIWRRKRKKERKK